MAKKKRTLAGIDVGTTKICSCIAELEGNNVQVLGVGWSASKGLRKGIVVNLSETIRSVKSSLEKAEREAGTVVEAAYVSVGGGYIRSTNSAGETDIRSKNGLVTADDITRAVAIAKEVAIPEDFEIIHVLTQGFSLDGQEGVIDPLGMSGKHLSVNLHLVLNATAVVQNIVNAINKAGVVVNSIVMQQLGSAEAVLTADEKELGTILIDIGGGTTDISVYNNGAIWHSAVLPVGGSLITKDIAIGLKAPLVEAESLKKEVGSVYPANVPEEEVIEVGEMGTGRQRTISRRLLCQIVEARCDEILAAISRLTKKLGVRPELVTGAVLTGGGALLHGLVEKAEEVLGMPVRLGYPRNVESSNEAVYHPAYATALGLLIYARDIRNQEVEKLTRPARLSGSRLTGKRVKNWILDWIG